MPFEELRDWATQRADDWYLAGGTDRLAFDAMSPGHHLRIDAFNAFFSIALRVAGQASDLDQTGIRQALKRRGLDRAARAWSLRALAAMRSRPKQAEVVVVSELATPSALLGPAAILDGWSSVSTAALAADPRALRFWRSTGLPAAPMITSLTNERRLLGSARRRFSEVWRRVESDPPLLLLGRVDVTSVAIEALRNRLLQSVPWLVVERAAIREALQRLRPEVVLLASDQHRIGSLVVEECRANGIGTIVMQHGLPQHAVGYVPVVADRVLTWSDRSMGWFVARGTAPSRLSVTGNPALDGPWRARQKHDRPEGPVTYLLALTPATQATNAGVVRMALDALATQPEARLIVKLHPGDGDWRYVRRLVQEHPVRSRVRVAHKERLGPLLLEATVTWLHRSSVALESLAVGVPVVVTAQDEPSTADLELEGLQLPVAEAPSQLAHLSADVIGEPGRSNYFTSRPVEAFVGPLDGGASSRARDAIVETVARARARH